MFAVFLLRKPISLPPSTGRLTLCEVKGGMVFNPQLQVWINTDEQYDLELLAAFSDDEEFDKGKASGSMHSP